MIKKAAQLVGTLLFICIILSITGCEKKSADGFLGSAVIEGTTFIVSSVVQGQLLDVAKREGDAVKNGELVAIIDTVQLVLKKKEIQANINEIEATLQSKKVDINAGQSDLDGAQREFFRVDTLAKKGAIPTQQRDNLKTQYDGARLRLDANQKTLLSLSDRIKGLKIRIEQADDQISDCYIKAPSDGIVSTKYRNRGEVVVPGTPIYEIIKYDTLTADFFVPQPALASITYGQMLKVRIDYDDGTGMAEKFSEGKVSWISDEAEFSPKNIQTRESRNELVFRVRLEIDNRDGMLKRGLPVEIWR
ncbi:MAG: HlyD family efflux transporter periplasmic adaptor subunit [Fibrobacter sp.]|nr:HlyD family efflux transporter periplasmic adaptor subunit [Fibrobacter sp.]